MGAERAQRRSYPRKAEIMRAVEAARASGLPVSSMGLELTTEGTIRLLPPSPAGAAESEYDRWLAEKLRG
jgi:hypothetical protein